MVKVLVAQRAEGTFSGFWAEFPAEEISSYEDEKGIVYTLYKVTEITFEGYRVHVADETNPRAPTYELHPHSKDQRIQGVRPDYADLFTKREIAERYPLFLKDIDYFQTLTIDPR